VLCTLLFCAGLTYYRFIVANSRPPRVIKPKREEVSKPARKPVASSSVQQQKPVRRDAKPAAGGVPGRKHPSPAGGAGARQQKGGKSERGGKVCV